MAGVHDEEATWGYLLGQRVADRYVVERLLVERRQGAVVEASDSEGIWVLKLLRVGRGRSEARSRWMREARVAASIANPHVVPVVAHGSDDELGITYLATPRYDTTLSEVLDDCAPLHPRAAVRIALQVCEGLIACHEVGVVHRDICPANIFVERINDDIFVRVGDFGIARALTLDEEEELTTSGRFLGTLVYSAPEQARSAKHVDERADLWSIGVILYEMLSGERPFDEALAPAELLEALTVKPVPSLQDRAPWVDPQLTRVVHRALERDRKLRFRSAAGMAERLLSLCGGDPRLRHSDLCTVPLELREKKADRAEELDAALGETGDRLLSHDELEDQTVAGYQVLRLLGRGATAAVYEARAESGDHVALKVLSRSWWGEQARSLARLRREARALASIHHDNVVRLFEVGHDKRHNLVFASMELVRGSDAARLFRQRAPIVPEPLVRLFVQAARGIAAAHELGVVHRDIKPANLLLDICNGSVTVKVADFGIAKDLDGAFDPTASDMTTTGAVVGSPAYMSPEQLRNPSAVDVRTDVWSLCVTLYEGLAGARPWRARTSFAELVLAICGGEVPPLLAAAPWVSESLAAVVHRGLERDPAARWPSMDALADALAKCVEHGEELVIGELRGVERRSRATLPSFDDVVESSARAPRAAPRPSRSRIWGALAVGALALGAAAVARSGAELQRAGMGLVPSGLETTAHEAEDGARSPSPTIASAAVSVSPSPPRVVRPTSLTRERAAAVPTSAPSAPAEPADPLRPPRSWP